MLPLFSTQVCCGNTFTSSVSEDCRFQTELSVGSSRDRQVRANETAVGRLISIKLSMTCLTSSSISMIGCGMGGRRDSEAPSPPLDFPTDDTLPSSEFESGFEPGRWVPLLSRFVPIFDSLRFTFSRALEKGFWRLMSSQGQRG